MLGKYWTILSLSVVYCFGHLALALHHTRIGLVVGLGLIALGAGGIKPCVSANVGDQFGPSNQHLLTRVFSWFYFAINFGSAFSTILIPWMLEPYTATPWLEKFLPSWAVSVLAKCHGPDIAFGTPGVLMLVATVIFWLGRKQYIRIPPVGVANYAKELVKTENLKALGNLLILVPFAAIFWSLWQQNFSSWVIQAEKMNRHILWWEPLPAQIQTVNPVFILLMLPLFSYAIYPAIEKVFRLTPLRKFGLGLFITASAFLVVAWIQGRIDSGGTPHIIWQIGAFVLLTAAEVMVSVTHLEFAYTQAPKKMKSLVMCTYLISVALGNAFTAGVNFFIQNKDGTSKLAGASYFYFFTAVMLATAVLFLCVARFYKGRSYIQDDVEAQPA